MSIQFIRCCSLIFFTCCLTTTFGFSSPIQRRSVTFSSALHADLFTGGWNDGVEAKAAKIASTIKSVKDLGWTKPPLRPGSIRPRHRAFGGQGESPIQEKANYDTSSPLCVEAWLTQDELNKKFKCEGPVGDTLFVALAGGTAFAERQVCEKIIDSWRGDKNKFDEAAFLKSVQAGRKDLAIGWAFFSFITGTAALGILFPTNPSTKLLEAIVAQAQGGYVSPL